MTLLELEKLELDEFELLEELLDDGGDELDELELWLIEFGVELEALIEDKEGLGPTSPHAARISTDAIRKDHFTDFWLNTKFSPLVDIY